MISRTLILVLLILPIFTIGQWQQEVKYKIEVELDDENHVLHAFESIVYVNNSPDTLSKIYFHLWPNAYQNKKTALANQLFRQGESIMHYASTDELGYIDSLDFKVNETKVVWSLDSEFVDIALLHLNEILLPGDSIKISTPFQVKFPVAGISRLGHDINAYQVTQWYPKPAVYDEKGWHPMYYLDQGEFYSEFGSFEVSITLPENYVVAATGDLVGGSRLTEEGFKKAKELFTEQWWREGAWEDKTGEFPTSSSQLKTLHFHQKNVHDFAFFADKRWLMESKDVLIPGSFKKVRVEVLYLKENANLWKDALLYAEKGLLFYSKNVGAYPYNHCTVVDGSVAAGGGMEYPNVTIIGEADNSFFLENTIVHEIGHNWLYGILGNNERTNSWMDEGLNSFYERKYLVEQSSDVRFSDLFGSVLKLILKDNDPPQEKYFYYAYFLQASRSLDQPTSSDSEFFYGDNYGSSVYAKSAVLFNYLAKYVGEEKFEAAMKLYFQKWKFKHPAPHDFRTVLEQELGLDLAWFFDDLLYTTKKMDYALRGVKKEDANGWSLLVENESDVQGPLLIDLMSGDSIIQKVWFAGFLDKAVLELPPGDFTHFMIDKEELTPDLNRENNFISVDGWFKKWEPFETNLVFSIPKADKSQLFYLPYLGYNANDKLKLGLVLYNSLLLEKKNRYLLMPTYGFGSRKLGGYYKVIHSSYFRNTFAHKLNYSLTYRRNGIDWGDFAGYWEKIEPKLELFAGRNSNNWQNLSLRYTGTRINLPGIKALNNQYCTLNYRLAKKHALYPFEFNGNAQLINYSSPKVWAEYKQLVATGEGKRSIQFRAFAGMFLGNSPNDLTHRFRMTAGNGADGLVESGGGLINRGMQDYLMDDVYLARYSSPDNFLSQQVQKNDGGFRTGLYLGANNKWLTAVNLTVPTPVRFIDFYADFALYPSVGNEIESAYSAGVQLTVFKDVLEVYFPVSNSNNINSNYDVVGLTNYTQKIKFLFNLGQYYHLVD